MSLFKKPNRKFRQRVTHSDSDNEEEEQVHNEKDDVNVARQEAARDPVTASNKPASLSNTTASTSISTTKDKIVAKLSFHDEDEEGEVFQVKKSNYSRRLAKQRERERKKRLEKLGTRGPQTTENNFQDTSNNSINDGFPNNNNSARSLVVNKTLKEDEPKTEPSFDSAHCQEVVQMELDSEDDDEKERDKSREENMRIIDQFRGALQSGVIPDAATIYAMKKRRQLAREMGEFGPNEDSEQSYENKSRLIRDDDNDRSDEDDGEEGRINFTVDTEVLERQKVKKAFITAEEEAAHGSGDEEAEELERWVQEQIRKGVSIPQVQPALPQPYQVEPSKLMSFEYQPPNFNTPTTVGFNTFSTVQKQIKKGAGVSNKKEKAAITTESIKQRLTEKVSMLSEARGLHERECTICQQSIRASEDAIEKLEKEAPNLAFQFKLYQEMRVYVADLIECLNAKVPVIDSLEQRMHTLWKKRADQLVLRRQQDIKDQADEFSFLCKRMTAGLGIDFSEDKYTTHDEVKLRRIAEREGRKMRRRKMREIKQPDVKHYEGLSSDNEESDLDLLRLAEEQEEILSEAQQVFDDVVDEYSNLTSAKQLFEKWKMEQPETYKDAYVPNCLPKILAPFIRLELLSWNPLYDSKDIENLGWYETLVFYGCGKESLKNYVDDTDSDLNLVPMLVDRVVIPKLTKIVENVWDPMSTVRTIRLVNLVKKYMDDYPEVNGKSKRVQAFLQAVVTRMCKTLDDDVFVPLYPKELLENRTVNANAFFQRQFWSCVKLLRNMLSWHGVLADKPLRELALNCLLNRYILLGLQKTHSDIAEKAKVINSVLPRTWFSPGENSVIPELEMYKKFTEPFTQIR